MSLRPAGALRRRCCEAAALVMVASCASQQIAVPVDTTPTPRATVAAIAILTQPSPSTPSGAAFTRQPAVQLRDAANAPIHEAGVAIAASLASGAGSLTGATTATTDASGTATFTNLAIAGAVGARTIAFTTGSIAVVSTSVDVTAGPPSKLAIVTQPSTSATSGDTLARQPVLRLLDAWNNASGTSGLAVSVGVASGGGAIVGSGTARTDANGVATFTGLALTGVGAQTLRFAALGVSPVLSDPVVLAARVPVDTAPAPTLLLSESFDDASLAARGWYDLPPQGLQAIVTSEHRAGAGSMQVNLPAGGTVAVPSVTARHLFTPTEAVYVRYWVKHSANWVGSGQPYHPHEFYLLTTEEDAYAGPSYTHLTIYIEENVRADGGYGVLAAQDSKNIDASRLRQDLTAVTEHRAVSGCNGNPDGTPADCYANGGTWYNAKYWYSRIPIFVNAPGAGYKGDWHEVEAYVALNSIANGIGQRDGVAQYWVDGALVIDRHDLVYRTGEHPTMRINRFLIGPYIGDGSPVAQTLWIDDLVLMTARPAP
ncbi:MAG TPA: hypothetical protein VHB25_03270 [Gemmatimonadaceae bacterium]|nr:hypothetical protein [Gemmatimonadaceae bacterium]